MLTIGRRFDFFGDNANAFNSKEPEVLLSGPAGSGKTLVWLAKILTLAGKYPGSRVLIVRKTRESLTESVLVTWERDILGPDHPILTRSPTLRRVRQSYDCGNGSVVVVGGLDKPDKVLSSEWDCVVGETAVDSPSRVSRAYGRPYSGQLVTITTAAGHKLTATPNHPILTGQGWVGVGLLRKGDYVFSRRRGNDLAGTHPDVTQKPATIADVVRSLTLSPSCHAERHVTRPVDFHGDATDGYVHVVTANGLLHHRGGPAVSQPPLQFDGGRRHLEKSALVRHRPLIERCGDGGTAGVPFAGLLAEFAKAFAVGFGPNPLLPGGLPPLPELGVPLTAGVADVPDALRLGRAASGYASCRHLAVESPDADVNALGDVHDATLPPDISLDRIVEIDITDAGRGRHVYNLQNESNWYYANNIITHNCIYAPEATDLTLIDWETLGGRLRAGAVPFQQLAGDCNPSSPTHFLYKRHQKRLLKLYSSRHQDNPRYFDKAANDWTPAGREYVQGRLSRMTGARRKRFLDGQWAAAEGLVYDGYDAGVHLLPKGWAPPRDWPRVWGIDWGFTNPTVLGFWAIDPDGRMHLYREFYRTHTRSETLAKWALAEVESGREPLPAWAVCDHDPEAKANFEEHGPPGVTLEMADKGDRLGGIEQLQARFDKQADGKPRVFVVDDCVAGGRQESLVDAGKPASFQDELGTYRWDTRNADRPKDEPLKEGDHSADQARYVVRVVDKHFGTPVDDPYALAGVDRSGGLGGLPADMWRA